MHLSLTLALGWMSLLGCQGRPDDCAPAAGTATTPPSVASATPSVASAAAPPPAPLPLGAAKADPAGAPSKAPLRSGDQVGAPSSLEDINRWATAAGVREDLLAWVAQGLATENRGAEVKVDYVGVESPVTAVATVTLDGYLDDSVRGERFVLKFSRKPCETCPSGMSGWWLWNMDVTRRCHKGRGHESFSKAPCL